MAMQNANNNASDRTIMHKIRSMTSKNYILLMIFLGVLAFFSWIIFDSIREIYKIYKAYLENSQSGIVVDETKKKMSSNDDDEVYTAGDDYGADNTMSVDKIRVNLSAKLAKYKDYNTLQKQQSKDPQDIVDEKIMMPQYDDYPKAKPKVSI
jgi:hypothetical protein